MQESSGVGRVADKRFAPLFGLPFVLGIFCHPAMCILHLFICNGTRFIRFGKSHGHTFKTIMSASVPQRLTRLQRVLNSLLSFLLATQ